MNKEDRCCGACCWFYAEDTDGWGFCARRKGDITEYMHCDDLCNDANDDDTDNFVSHQEMRHHMAVLLQTNRYRRDDNVPSVYRMPNPKEIGKAIDFAYEYMKIFSEL